MMMKKKMKMKKINKLIMIIIKTIKINKIIKYKIKQIIFIKTQNKINFKII